MSIHVLSFFILVLALELLISNLDLTENGLISFFGG